MSYSTGDSGVAQSHVVVSATVEQSRFHRRILCSNSALAFPYGLPIAADGYGNFWVVDLHPHTVHWGPIYFACHDPPVILYQADALEQFLAELFRMFKPPHQSLVDDVHEDRLAHVWQTNPGFCPTSNVSALEIPSSQLSHANSMTVFRLLTCGGGSRGWLFLGPLRSQDSGQALRYASRVRLPEAEGFLYATFRRCRVRSAAPATLKLAINSTPRIIASSRKPCD